MAEEVRFKLADKAENLYFDVFNITTNRDHYPVKYRRMADKLQEYALDIYNDIMDANSFISDTPQHKVKRFDLQTSAITKCNKFLSLVKYSVHAKLISFAKSEEWTKKAHDIKNMALAWRKNTIV